MYNMYIQLTCGKCGDSASVSFAALCKIWKKAYEALADEHKDKAKAVTEVTCHCGHRERYEGPMFTYIFQLIFDEFVKKEKI